jgi:hypothetical protein
LSLQNTYTRKYSKCIMLIKKSQIAISLNCQFTWESFLRKLWWRTIKNKYLNLSICWHFCGWYDKIKFLNSYIKMHDITLMFKQFFSHLNIKIFIWNLSKNIKTIKFTLFSFQAYSSCCHYFPQNKKVYLFSSCIHFCVKSPVAKVKKVQKYYLYL